MGWLESSKPITVFRSVESQKRPTIIEARPMVEGAGKAGPMGWEERRGQATHVWGDMHGARASLTLFTELFWLCAVYFDICECVNCVFFKVHLICDPVFVYKVICV